MPPEDNTQIAIRHVVSGLAMMALDYGMASRRDSDTLVPFVLMESDGQCYTQRFDAEPYEAAVAEAKAFLAKVSDSTSAYALAYDGFVTVEGTHCRGTGRPQCVCFHSALRCGDGPDHAHRQSGVHRPA